VYLKLAGLTIASDVSDDCTNKSNEEEEEEEDDDDDDDDDDDGSDDVAINLCHICLVSVFHMRHCISIVTNLTIHHSFSLPV